MHLRAGTTLLLLVLLLACGGRRARPVDPPQIRRAAYIRDIGAVLADPGSRRDVAARLDTCVLTELIPYGAAPLLATARGRARLTAWIADVRRRGGRVIAPIAGLDRVAALSLPGAPTFDGFVTELEYWNRPDREAALEELLALVAAMRALAGTAPVGVYLGYPTAAEAARIAAVVDFVFLDYSVRDPRLAWRHVHGRGGPLRDRIAWFTRAGVAVWPIFYAEGEVDMRTRLATDGLGAAEARFRTDMRADPAMAEAELEGFVYFTAGTLPAPRDAGCRH